MVDRIRAARSPLGRAPGPTRVVFAWPAPECGATGSGPTTMLRSRTSPTTTCRPPEHLRNVNAEGELAEDATTEDSSVVQIEGSRRIRRLVKLFDWERSAPPLGQLGASSRFSRRSLRQYGGILGLNFIREAYHATSLARMAGWCARGSSTVSYTHLRAHETRHDL